MVVSEIFEGLYKNIVDDFDSTVARIVAGDRSCFAKTETKCYSDLNLV